MVWKHNNFYILLRPCLHYLCHLKPLYAKHHWWSVHSLCFAHIFIFKWHFYRKLNYYLDLWGRIPIFVNQTIRYLVSNTSLTRAIVRRHFSCNFLFIVSCDRDYQFFIGRIHLFILKRFQVCFRHLDREMAQCLADDADTHSCMKSQRSPCMARCISNI